MREPNDNDGDTVVPLRRLVLVIVVLGTVLALGGTAWATSWPVTLKLGGSGEAHAQAAPTAPSSVSAACTGSSAQTIKVSWIAVAKATTYSVYDTTTSATGTYVSIATSVSSTSWTSGALTAGNHYWFEVAAYIGTNWVGSKSSATSQATISTSGCTQP